MIQQNRILRASIARVRLLGPTYRVSSGMVYRQLHYTPCVLQEVKKPASTPEKTSDLVKPAAPQLSLWEKVKHEVNHYWDGTKLLGLEIKISFKLALKSVAGYELTRRENKQLQRTIQDIVRLVPFSMFVIIPFAELLLPVALKIFPGLLPSTYESNAEKDKKRQTLRDTRKKVSNLLRETAKLRLPVTATEEQREGFKKFITDLRTGVEPPTIEQTLKVARLFKDDTVLDNLQRPQIIAMARYLNLQPIGTNEMLRFRIRYQLLRIKQDDRAIDYEGVDSLSTLELQAACAARGIKVNGINPGDLNHDLKLWLDLTLREKIPATLLVLSNAYTYGNLDSHDSIYDALQAVLSSMPEEVHHVVEADVDTEITNKQRLNLIKEQEELIQTETKQEEDTGVKIQVKDKINLDEPEQDSKEVSTEETIKKDESPTTEKKQT